MNQASPSMGDRIRAALVSCGGLGYAPVASGTLAGIALVLALLPLRDQEWFHFGGAMIVGVLVCMAIGVACGPWAERYYGKKDPGHFVIDEVAGYYLTLFRLDGGFPGLKEIVVAFFAFRLFDVIKPPPGRRIEKLPFGWVIMLDDLVAGVYAALLIYVLRDYFQWEDWSGWSL